MLKISYKTLFLKRNILVKHTAGTTKIRVEHMTAYEQYLAYEGIFSGPNI
jgi:hypothetical protein